MTDPERRLGKIRITGKALDEMISTPLMSQTHLLDMLEYDRANDTWVFLAEGPDFPLHIEGGPAPYVDQTELRLHRYSRDGIVDIDRKPDDS